MISFLKLFHLLVVIIGFSGLIHSQECRTTTDGSFTGGIWTNCGAEIPTCDDTQFFIDNLVSFGQESYDSCSMAITITVNGGMEFANNSRLILPAGSSVILNPGGALTYTGSGGGNNSYISVGGSNIWLASNGSLTNNTGTPCIVSPGGLCAPLPVELLHFKAELAGQHVRLNWATASEINNDHFTVFRSHDGQRWTEIGRVPGHGNSLEVIEYQYWDKSPLKGVSYYRLRQTDFDGTSELFDVRSVRMEREGPLDLRHLPGTQEIEVSGLEADKPATLELFDLSGRCFFRNRLEGGTQVRTPVPSLYPGMILARVSQAGVVSSLKLAVPGH